MKVTYYASHSFRSSDGKSHTMITQLYQVGIYVIFDGKPSLQGGMTPQKLSDLQNNLRKDAEKGLITDLKFGQKMTVSDDSGGWKIVADLDAVFVQEGKGYECTSPVTHKVYLFTVTGLKLSEERHECVINFKSDPKCEELSMFTKDRKNFEANVFSFQRVINPLPVL